MYFKSNHMNTYSQSKVLTAELMLHGEKVAVSSVHLESNEEDKPVRTAQSVVIDRLLKNYTNSILVVRYSSNE